MGQRERVGANLPSTLSTLTKKQPLTQIDLVSPVGTSYSLVIPCMQVRLPLVTPQAQTQQLERGGYKIVVTKPTELDLR